MPNRRVVFTGGDASALSSGPANAIRIGGVSLFWRSRQQVALQGRPVPRLSAGFQIVAVWSRSWASAG